jgi:hypothetical protein
VIESGVLDYVDADCRGSECESKLTSFVTVRAATDDEYVPRGLRKYLSQDRDRGAGLAVSGVLVSAVLFSKFHWHTKHLVLRYVDRYAATILSRTAVGLYFAGAKGVILFKDAVVNLKFDFRGHISLEWPPSQ